MHASDDEVESSVERIRVISGDDISQVLGRIEYRNRSGNGPEPGEIFEHEPFASVDEYVIGTHIGADLKRSLDIDAHVRDVHRHLDNR